MNRIIWFTLVTAAGSFRGTAFVAHKTADVLNYVGDGADSVADGLGKRADVRKGIIVAKATEKAAAKEVKRAAEAEAANVALAEAILAEAAV